MKMRLSQLHRIINEEVRQAISENEDADATTEALMKELCVVINEKLGSYGEKKVKLYVNDDDATYNCEFDETAGTFTITHEDDGDGEKPIIFKLSKAQ